jgi:3-phenylpropionate/cinnamic acid dioxygenase small subunit
MNQMMQRIEIEEFLYKEARLMDENQYAEWLSLWTDDGVYWIPCRHEHTDPSKQVSLVYDNRAKLSDRVARLLSGGVLAQEPLPRLRRVVSNVEIFAEAADELTVGANFMLVQARAASQYLWCGRSIYRLKKSEDGLRIAHKRVLLVNSEQEMPVLQFLI